MATTEQFSLRWNNFHSNMTSGFHELLEAAEMVDVTLAVDGHFLQAHKIVLSICSPYFKQMFKVNPCKHPIVILKDVGHENMKDILEFMYMGEVSVLRDNLTQFLRTAELLQVKGLTGDDSSEDASSSKDTKGECDNEDENEMYSQLIEADVELPPYSHPSPIPTVTHAKRTKNTSNGSTNNKRTKQNENHPQSKSVKNEFEPVQSKMESNSPNQQPVNNTIVNTMKPNSDIDEIKEPINMKTVWDNNFSTSSAELLNSSDQAKCHTCGKWMRRSSIRRHMYDVHLPNQQLPCDLCHKYFKTANSLTTHLITIHKKFKSERQNLVKEGFEGHFLSIGHKTIL